MHPGHSPIRTTLNHRRELLGGQRCRIGALFLRGERLEDVVQHGGALVKDGLSRNGVKGWLPRRGIHGWTPPADAVQQRYGDIEGKDDEGDSGGLASPNLPGGDAPVLAARKNRRDNRHRRGNGHRQDVLDKPAMEEGVHHITKASPSGQPGSRKGL